MSFLDSISQFFTPKKAVTKQTETKVTVRPIDKRTIKQLSDKVDKKSLSTVSNFANLEQEYLQYFNQKSTLIALVDQAEQTVLSAEKATSQEKSEAKKLRSQAENMLRSLEQPFKSIEELRVAFTGLTTNIVKSIKETTIVTEQLMVLSRTLEKGSKLTNDEIYKIQTDVLGTRKELTRNDLIEFLLENKDLHDIFLRYGYSAELDKKAREVIETIKRHIRVEIPDFTEFTKAILAVENQIEQHFSSSEELKQEILERVKIGTFFHRVKNALDSKAAVLDILNENPLEDFLPFLEQMPVVRQGKLTWMTPNSVTVLRKHPPYKDECRSLLFKLDTMFKDSGLPKSPEMRKEILDLISRLMRDLDSTRAYLPTTVLLLERKISDGLDSSATPGERNRKKLLTELITDIQRLRFSYGIRRSTFKVLSTDEIEHFAYVVKKQAQQYLDAPWMHSTIISGYLVSNFLEAENLMSRYKGENVGVSDNAKKILRLISEEIDSGFFDGEDILRRLYYLESQGMYIHTMVHALIRILLSKRENRRN